MKKLLFILMTVLPIVVFSQSIGVKGGAVFSNTNYSKYINEGTLTSPVFGVVYQRSFNRFLLSVEPGFVTKGFTDDYSYTDNNGNPLKGTYKAKYKFNYFELPVLIGYNILDKDLYFGLNAGLAANFLTSAKVKQPSISADNNGTQATEYKLKGNNTFTADVVGGGYIGYKLSDNLFVAVNVRYGKGLGKIHPNSDGSYSYLTTFLNIGYKF